LKIAWNFIVAVDILADNCDDEEMFLCYASLAKMYMTVFFFVILYQMVLEISNVGLISKASTVIEYAGSYFRGPESSSRLVDESS
jgi:hypothetical protein